MSRKPELRGRAARLARLLPAHTGQAARTPFVLLVVLLLGSGLIGLLMLNSALSEGAFKLDDLQDDVKNYTDEEQSLQRDVDAYSAPEALQRRARELGMVPGGDPAFLEPDGTVKGVPGPAARQSTARVPLVLAPEVLDARLPEAPAPTSTPTPSFTPAQQQAPAEEPPVAREQPSVEAPVTAATPTAPSVQSTPLSTNPGR